MNAVLLYEFKLGGHGFRAYWLPERKEWLVVNSAGQFSFKASRGEATGEGRLKAHVKMLLSNQYEYLMDNAHRIIARIGSTEGYLDSFPFRVRKKWARQAVLA